MHTTKYSVLTFLPKNLYEQFRRLANFYFLIVCVVTLIPGVTPIPPVTSIAPLVFVLSVAAAKEGYEDWRRAADDARVNAKPVRVVVRDPTTQLPAVIRVQSQDVAVGDLLVLRKNTEVPADAIVLATSNPRSTLHGAAVGGSTCYVETSNLDGESALKPRSCLPVTAGISGLEELLNLSATVSVSEPSPSLFDFEGSISLDASPGIAHALSLDNLLLRGSRVKNTDWVFALVLYTGDDTKLVLNLRPPPSKRSHVELRLNAYLVWIFVILMTLCILGSGLSGYYNSKLAESALYLDLHRTSPTWHEGAKFYAFGFCTFLILLNVYIPMSLYVCIELAHFLGSLWVMEDIHMYDPETDSRCKCNTSNLLEELGQIESVFCDKTGTLTANEMVFREASISGTHYTFDPSPSTKTLLTPAVVSSSESLELFFLVCALCHTVYPSEDEAYEATSPDELALVLGSASVGIVFRSRAPQSLTVELHGELVTYQLLHTLPFDSDRKRMTVVVACPDGRILALVKGADSTLEPLLDTTSGHFLWGETDVHLTAMSTCGLRTLVIAYRELDPEWYAEWDASHREAQAAMGGDRAARVAASGQVLETGLTLLGATAIEDRLQDQVPESIQMLRDAGCRVWVLTGDKQETAINIGYSASLLTPEMDIVRLNATSREETAVLLGSIPPVAGPRGIIVDGVTLHHALHADNAGTFLARCNESQAVLCCRVSPRQKALVVRLVQTAAVSPVAPSRAPITLAVGDGANDVGMILEADVGVGIVGKEGMQAARAADYALGQFRFLTRLMLVHGRYSYLRLAVLIQFSFYKNIAFALPQAYFALVNGFSGQTLYDAWLMTMFNIIYTFLPIMTLSLVEQDIRPDALLAHPGLYRSLPSGEWYDARTFSGWMASAIWHSLVSYFGGMAVFKLTAPGSNGQMTGLWCLGTSVCTYIIIIVSLRICMETRHWTVLNGMALFLSVGGYVLMLYVYSLIHAIDPSNMYYVTYTLSDTSVYWASVVVIPAIALLPDVTLRVFRDWFFPTPSLIVREQSVGACESSVPSVPSVPSEAGEATPLLFRSGA